MRIALRHSGLAWTLAVGLASMIWGAAPTFADNHVHATPESYAKTIRSRGADILGQLNDGQQRAALDAARALNAEVDQYVSFMDTHPDTWAPDLILGQIYHRTGNYDDVLNQLAPVLQNTDAGNPRHTRLRTESRYWLGISLYRMGRHNEAGPMLRRYLADADQFGLTQVFPAARDTYARVVLSFSASFIGAPDAGAIRRDTLNGYMQRPGAKADHFLELAAEDLRIRLRADVMDAALVSDADTLVASLAEHISDYPDLVHEIYLWVSDVYQRAGQIESTLDYARAAHSYFEASAPGTVLHMRAAVSVAKMLNLSEAPQDALEMIQTTLRTLDEMPPAMRGSEDFMILRARLHEVATGAASLLGDRALYQEQLRAAYAAFRAVLPASHIRLQSMVGYIDPQAAARAGFAYMDELTYGGAANITPTPDGAEVLSLVLAGERGAVERLFRTDAYLKHPQQALVKLNKVWFHALMGDVDEGRALLKELRQIARVTPDAGLPANDVNIDLAEATLMLYARDHARSGKADALVRLERRTSLSDRQRAFVRMLRMTYLINETDFAPAQLLFDRHGSADSAYIDASPMGTLLGLGHLNIALLLGDLTTGRALTTRLTPLFDNAPDRAMARMLVDLYNSNVDPAYLATEEGFVALTFLLRDLQKVVPLRHQWNVVVHTIQSYALADRGLHSEAQEVMETALAHYRKAPEHRADAAGFMQSQAAFFVAGQGQTELANSLYETIWDTVDLDTWRGNLWVSVAVLHIYALRDAGRYDQAVKVVDQIAANPRAAAGLLPREAAMLHTAEAELAYFMGEVERAQAAYDRAIAVLPFDTYADGTPMADALMRRSFFYDYHGKISEAFADISRSNELYFDRVEDLQSNGEDVLRFEEVDRFRIGFEASVAWKFAQSLKASDR